MPNKTLEQDWKYIRSIHDELLANLCERINLESVTILNKHTNAEHKVYLALYQHIRTSDRI